MAAGGTDRVVRVFVSSTFRDMQRERSRLAARTFQRLRKLCEQRGVTWSEVDLRWGITDEQRVGGQVLPICLAEIDRCRPYFMVMLGERYGEECTAFAPDLIRQYPWLSGHEGASIAELEILHGALNDPRRAVRTFVYLREPGFVAALPENDRSTFVETATAEELRAPGLAANAGVERRTRKLVELKKLLRASGLPTVREYRDADALADVAFEDLERAILADFGEAEPQEPGVREARVHEQFAETRRRIYIARPSDLRRLDAHVDSNHRPLVVLGESGVGKTALLANWRARRLERDRDATIVQYFVGASAESTDWRHLVRDVAARLGTPISTEAEDDEGLRIAFANALHRASSGRRCILVLDALNQLENREGALDLAWLPVSIPPDVRIVLSTLEGRVLDECRRRAWPSMTVRRLARRERERLLVRYLREKYAKTLSSEQRARIAAARLSPNPLWLTSLLEELRLYGDHETLDRRITHYLGAQSIPELFGLILARWEADYDGERPQLVRDTMLALWAARRGASEIELRELLGGKGGSLPPLTWSVFQFAADHALVSRSGLLGFFHDYLRDAVRTRYLPARDDERAAHRALATWFAAKEPSPRRTDELPWQLDRSESWSELRSLLSDLDFFHDAWDRDPLDVKGYWADLEAQAEGSRVSAYRAVIDEPASHLRDAGAVGTLLEEAGHIREVVPMYERLERVFEQSDEPLERARVLTKLARARDGLGERAEALAAHAEAERVFREAGPTEDLIVSLGEQGQIRIRQGSPDRALVLIDEALRLALERGEHYDVQSLLLNRAEILTDRYALADAEDCLRQAEAICVKLGDRDALQRVYGYLSNLRHAQRRFGDALLLTELKERICTELGDRGGRAAALNSRAVLLSESGRAKEARGLLDVAETIYREIDSVAGLATTLGNRGSVMLGLDRLEEASALFAQQESLYRAHDELADLDTCLLNQARLAARREGPDRALVLIDRAAEAAERTGHRSFRATIRAERSQLLVDRGDRAGAFRELQLSAREFKELGNQWEEARTFCYMCDTLLADDRPKDAMAAAKWAERLGIEMESPAAIVRALDRQADVFERVDQLDDAIRVRNRELELRRTLGDEGDQLALVNKIIGLAHQRGDLPALLRALDEQAALLLRLGRAPELRAQLETAIAGITKRGDLDEDNETYLRHLRALLARIAPG